MSTTIGNYRVVQKLGEGGMGVVYLGEHAVIGRQAAIKLLLPAMSANAEAVARFFNEARATARIKHPGIVEIVDCGQLANGQAYIVMEYLQGETLGAYGARGGKLSGHIEVARAIVRQVAAALSAAHARGIIHRDLKPDNVFLSVADIGGGHDTATVKILDFGIAKLVSAGKVPVITHTKELLGTPVYISPEQCKGAKDLDHRTDIYSLGCIAFELLTGAPVFQADSIGELIGHHMFKEPPPLLEREPDVPPAFGALVMRMLAKAPDDRPRSMDDVVSAIDAEGVPSALRGSAIVLPPSRPLNLTSPEPPGSGVPTVLAGSGPAATLQTPPPQSTFSGLVSESRPEVPSASTWGKKPWAVAGVCAALAAFAWLAVGRAPAPARAPRVASVPTAAAPTPPAPSVVDVEDAPPGLTVSVDGRPSRLPVSLPPGSSLHHLVFEAPGYSTMTRDLDATKSRTLVLGMHPLPPPPEAAPTPSRPGPTPVKKAVPPRDKAGKRRSTDLFLDL